MAKKTLLEKAKAVKMGRRDTIITDEHVELALAWIRDEVNLSQINVALKKSRQSGNVLYKMATSLREAHRQGKIKIISK